MKFDLIIFDLDGTLVNSIPDLTDSLNHVAKIHNLPCFNENQVAESVGGGIKKLIQTAFNIQQNDAKFHEFFNEFMNHHEKNITNRSHLYKNSLEILNFYKDKKLAILSNKVDYLTKQVVVDFKIDNYFDFVLGATKKLQKKPSGEPIEYILNQLKVHPSAAIMVGDSEPDIMCAKNAGIKTVALTCGYRTANQLKPLKPDFMIDNIIDLKTIIED